MGKGQVGEDSGLVEEKDGYGFGCVPRVLGPRGRSIHQKARDVCQTSGHWWDGQWSQCWV